MFVTIKHLQKSETKLTVDSTTSSCTSCKLGLRQAHVIHLLFVDHVLSIYLLLGKDFLMIFVCFEYVLERWVQGVIVMCNYIQ